jgi:predicted secreted protein
VKTKRGRTGFLLIFLTLWLMLAEVQANTCNADTAHPPTPMSSASSSNNAPTMQWNKTYGGAGEDVAFSVLPKADGGYTVAGHTTSFGGGNDDFWLIQTDSDGQMLWNKTFGGAGDEGAFAMVRTSEGGYALAGDIDGSGSLGWDFWLVKTDSDGNLLFSKNYGGPNEEGALAVIQARDGGYLLAGGTKPAEVNAWDLWLVKTDAQGEMVWNQTYGGSGDDEAFAVAEATDGGYMVAGRTSSFGSGGYDFWLIKTDSKGTMQWNRTYGGTGDEAAFCILQTQDGGYALAGNTKPLGAAGYDFLLLKTDANGNLLWNKTYGGAGDEGVFSTIQTCDGGFLLAGDTNSFGIGGYDFWLIKTASDGEVVWNQTFGGVNDDGAFSVAQTSDGGYVIAGDTKSFGAGNWDFWLVKLAPETEVDVPPATGFEISVVVAVIVVIGIGIAASLILKLKRTQNAPK